MPEEKLVLSTTGSREEAQRIAHTLVQERLAACVNVIGPMQSVYRWQNNIDTAEEFLLLIKTTAAAYARVQARVRALHSYQLPEIVELNITGGSAEYLKWVADCVKS
jgi:periplasmic divalent cation tolerance protein